MEEKGFDYPLFFTSPGGHFIVYMTRLPQAIKGVELVNMGQQGSAGRYAMHFHLCQDTAGSYVKKCSVHESNQRCYVMHGTWNSVVQDNVGFNTAGHCFMVEDGIEYGNMFRRNLAFNQVGGWAGGWVGWGGDGDGDGDRDAMDGWMDGRRILFFWK